MTGFLPPDSVARRVVSEPLLLVGGGRALLMQLAHPAVAAGVAEHSDFRSDAMARLRQTVGAVAAIVFGTEAQAREVAGSLQAVHARVVGAGYRATDPALQLWVHATLVDTSLRTYSRFLGPLGPDDAERFYQDTALVGEVLGIPRDAQPPDLASFHQYVRTMVTSLEVTETARQLAHYVLNPTWGPAAGPALALHRSLTAGLLPARLRRQYGLRWDWAGHFALQAATAGSRLVLPRVPAPLRRAPGLLL